MRLNVNLSGFAGLADRLSRMAEKDALSAAQSASRVGAKVLATQIAKEAPVSDIAEGTIEKHRGKSYQHHKIVNSITIKKVRTSDDLSVSNAVGDGQAFQAMFEEFGTIHQAANAFMLRALEGHEQEIIDAMATILAKQITKKGG